MGAGLREKWPFLAVLQAGEKGRDTGGRTRVC